MTKVSDHVVEANELKKYSGGVNRDASIDVLKGIGISLVLIAHSLGGYVHTFAYSFHMPLFFLVSGYFFRPQSIRDALSKDFSRLMIPFFFTALLMFVGACLLEPFHFKDIKTPQYTFEALIYGNASSVNNHKIWGDFACIGSVWFLGALFWAKSIFNALFVLLNKKEALIILVFLSIASAIVGQYLLLPYSLIQGCTALPFLWIGYMLKKIGLNAIMQKTISKALFLLLAILWFISTFYSCLDMAQVKWAYYYIPNILLATAGTGVFYIISSYIVSHFNVFASFLAFLGKYSIVLVCFPVVETYLIPLKEVIPASVPFHGYAVLACKVAWVVITLWMSIKMPFLRYIFSIK